MGKENINKFNEKELFDAKDLRTAKIAYNDAGCYKWWARETNVELLVKGLNKIDLKNNLKKILIQTFIASMSDCPKI